MATSVTKAHSRFCSFKDSPPCGCPDAPPANIFRLGGPYRVIICNPADLADIHAEHTNEGVIGCEGIAPGRVLIADSECAIAHLGSVLARHDAMPLDAL